MFIVASTPLTPAMVFGALLGLPPPPGRNDPAKTILLSSGLNAWCSYSHLERFLNADTYLPFRSVRSKSLGVGFCQSGFFVCLFVFLNALLYEEPLISLANSEHKILEVPPNPNIF